MKMPIVLLVTDDPETASAARIAAERLDHRVHHLASGPDAISVLMDSSSDFAYAVIDLDRHAGNHAVFTTAAGVMPVVGLTSGDGSAVTKIERRCHAVGHLRKPLSSDRAQAAFARAARVPSGPIGTV